MNFGKSFARALLPVTILAAAVPSAAASDSSDLARLKAHIGGVQTMTADFIQTDARRDFFVLHRGFGLAGLHLHTVWGRHPFRIAPQPLRRIAAGLS